MEDFHISETLSTAQIQAFLQAAMPNLTLFGWDMLLDNPELMEFNSADFSHIFFESTESEVPQFPQHLAIYRTPNEHEEARALWLGQKLSAAYEVDVLVPFTHPEEPQNPFYDIVFKSGICFLADDSETEFGELDAKPVRILGPYSLPKAKFDASGNCITV